MLLRGDVAKKMDEMYQNFLKPLHKVSDNLIQLDDSSLGMYSFDDISASFFEKIRKPTSADAVCFDSRRLVFVEFKKGFNDSDEYPTSKGCAHCKEHQKNISGSLLLKIAETHKVFERFFLETISEKTEQEHNCRVEFWIVLNDAEPRFSPLETIEAIQEEMSGIGKNSKNYVTRISDSVKRFRHPGYWFDEVEVMSARDFKTRKDLYSFLRKVPSYST